MKNKNWIIYLIVVAILIAVASTMIIIAQNSLKNSDSKISKKIDDELTYLDKTTLSMINQLNNLKTIDEIQIKRTSVGNASQNVMTNTNQESSGESEAANSQSQSGGQTASSEGNAGDSSKTQNIEKYYIEDNAVLLRDTSTVDWNELEVQAENLYDSWTTITLDLNTMNVSSENILAYNTNLDNLIMSIKAKDKANSAICLANLYSLLPKYMNETLEDETKIKIENIKSNIVSAYSLVEIQKWDDIINLLGRAENELESFINTANNISATKRAKMNKAYVLLKELIKSSNEKNADLFYLKYINLIQEIENIV